jgi:hypothetical protein
MRAAQAMPRRPHASLPNFTHDAALMVASSIDTLRALPILA